MKYAKYPPAKILKPYIDAYWVLETDSLFQPVDRRIFADGCTEIFINMGHSAPMINGVTQLMPGNIYLGGTMTIPNIVSSVPNSCFVGILFKPAGINAFYNLPLEELVDRIIEFPDKALMSIVDIDDQLPHRLDQFFLNKINATASMIISLTSIVERHKGIISVDRLAKEYHLTNRTLERSFKRELGISPKTFINIVKFTHASKRIHDNKENDSLQRIAYEMGYYDHSHLLREIKRFTGLTPSEIA